MVMKKNEILPLATVWVELECIMLSKVSQSEKHKYHMRTSYQIPYVEFKKQNDECRGREGKIK